MAASAKAKGGLPRALVYGALPYAVRDGRLGQLGSCLRLPARLAAGPLRQDVQWYNDDRQLASALIEVGTESRQMGLPNGAARVDELSRLDATTRKAYGFYAPPPIVSRIYQELSNGSACLGAEPAPLDACC